MYTFLSKDKIVLQKYILVIMFLWYSLLLLNKTTKLSMIYTLWLIHFKTLIFFLV
jgi:hypothetical protein